ncbi:preprotein translocase subunit YajC [Corynebacterium glaucum]|uniref:preprotein translocase subunit YajC n=1 Tax=Corynebacterium glaucum TaxID=187491 RepID=UPI002659B00B|nr:preprotein translocase subunit YajC [Corynebacterium glaucum]
MEALPLLVILLLFLVPPMLLMRSQRKRAQEVSQMQASIQAGDRIVSVAGLHGTVVANTGEALEVEIAPGVVVTMDTGGVMKKVES